MSNSNNYREQETPDTTVEFVKIKQDTAKAWLIDFGDVQHWLPKSQCAIEEENKKITLPGWLYKEKFPNG